MTPFTLPWGPNPDLDIHQDPVEGWHRVAVICGWSDARKARERWPDAAVVGPLRTIRGIDLLIRSLLANPQIRVLVVDGQDLTPGEATLSAFTALFADGNTRGLTKALAPHFHWLRDFVDVAYHAAVYGTGAVSDEARQQVLDAVTTVPLYPAGDRPGGTIILPPPAPVATARAPHGDPGDRIAGATLVDVWPRILRRAFECGREVPTQYGGTRELLSLVSVIRDPAKTLDDLPVAQLHPDAILQIKAQDVEAYYQRLVGSEVPEGAAYSYGSRLRGVGAPGQIRWPTFAVRQEVADIAVVELNALDYYAGTKEKVAVVARAIGRATPSCATPTDQIGVVDKLLSEKPDTRAAFLTPWRPDEDCGKESGRPCLVGAWFRSTPAGSDNSSRDALSGSTGETPGAVEGGETSARQRSTLHLTVVFRSHDLFGAYPLNLAAACLWLVRTAEKHGMLVGSLTCLSMSAHVYERDYAVAQAVAEGYEQSGIRWDQRTSWHVTTVGEMNDEGLRADALAPDGSRVVASFQAKTPETLMRLVAESGLIQEVGSALWLGAEIEKLWRST